MFIYFETERERESEPWHIHEQGRGRKKEIECQVGSMLSAQSLTQGSNAQTLSS